MGAAFVVWAGSGSSLQPRANLAAMIEAAIQSAQFPGSVLHRRRAAPSPKCKFLHRASMPAMRRMLTLQIYENGSNEIAFNQAATSWGCRLANLPFAVSQQNL
ncbi:MULTISPECIES: hypothetical protein [unclassified Ruegeria]|uniref:hypothetical protein n=1 Tax=unclassified Ruegeria TaxID=2625375 RepID=UPI00148A10AF|nr:MULTISPECIES: hypothetical protein [unclassified Ruegeria]NOD37008.1 hypothetical protein [Ruegeria sp. HKCCD7296]NOE44196.1 hypothetical protein [Ruegeria sp. HKCCD7319]